jgi:ABC-2 type transport system permease protein
LSHPYVPYVQYLLPGSIKGNLRLGNDRRRHHLFIDDKARGLHEGCLTPIRKFELILVSPCPAPPRPLLPALCSSSPAR